jgi:hypothetical protein
MTAVFSCPAATLPTKVLAGPIAELVQIWPPDAARVMEVAADVRKAVGAGVTETVAEMATTWTGVWREVVSLRPRLPKPF